MRRRHHDRRRRTGSGTQGDPGEFELTVSISVLAPGLAAGFPGIAPDSFTDAPALSHWLSRAQRQAFAPGDLEAAALTLFHVPHSSDRFPVAPFRYLGDCGHPPAGYCLNADPVHLRADTRGLLLFDAAQLALQHSEAVALAGILQPLLDEDDWTLETPTPEHWYLGGTEIAGLDTTPLPRVRGKPVAAFLPRGAAAAEWLKRSNEWQMLLHNHAVNRQRAAQGAAALNSLWIWGGGCLPEPGGNCFDRIYSDDALLRGLARWSASPCETPPANADALLAENPGDGSLLLVVDGCSQPAAYDDFPAWNAALESLERNWFAGLLGALRRRRIHRLELLALDGFRYILRPRDSWRLWRRLRDYRELLNRSVQA